MTNPTPAPKSTSQPNSRPNSRPNSQARSTLRPPSGSGPTAAADEIPVLADDVPVTMPELPPRLVITTAEQFKAIAEPTRSRILGIIQNQPATAKQIADRLGIAPGASGHHLQVLEAAGLAQIVARRIVRGIIAKYYARTARIFAYDMSPDVTGGLSPSLEIMTHAANEFADSVAERDFDKEGEGCMGFPHARISPERAKVYAERLEAIQEDLLREPQNPDGVVYGVFTAMFRSPDYMQYDMQGDTPAPTAGDTSDATTGTEVKGDER